jgi:FkbM family methyltransferase
MGPVALSAMSATNSPPPPGASEARSARTAGDKSRNFRRQLRATWRHPGNAGHRTRAIARLLLFHVRARVFHKRTCVPIGDHSKMWADRRFAHTVQLVLGNPPDWEYMQAWKTFLGPGTLFVDVGANAGLYSLWAADLGSTVIAVEPEPAVRKALEESAALNRYEFEIIPAALSDEAGTMRLSHGKGSANHLLVDDGADGDEVEVRTLDEVLGDRTADGMKIDVEGAEYLVLRGAALAMAQRRIPVIQLEWNRTSRKHFGETRKSLADVLVASGYEFLRPDRHGHLELTDPGKFGKDVFAVLKPPLPPPREP